MFDYKEKANEILEKINKKCPKHAVDLAIEQVKEVLKALNADEVIKLDASFETYYDNWYETLLYLEKI